MPSKLALIKNFYWFVIVNEAYLRYWSSNYLRSIAESRSRPLQRLNMSGQRLLWTDNSTLFNVNIA